LTKRLIMSPTVYVYGMVNKVYLNVHSSLRFFLSRQILLPLFILSFLTRNRAELNTITNEHINEKLVEKWTDRERERRRRRKKGERKRKRINTLTTYINGIMNGKRKENEKMQDCKRNLSIYQTKSI